MSSRALAPALLALAALALTGCETTAEKSAKLERLAKAHERRTRAHATPLAARVARASIRAKVTSSAVLSGSEGIAVVVAVSNISSTTLRGVPIEITVRDAHGAALYTNDAPGLAPSLSAIPLVPAHSTVYWIDDQVQSGTPAASVAARVGEGEAMRGAVPALSTEASLVEGSGSAGQLEGRLENRSGVEQLELVVDAVARRGGRIVAAGRAVLTQAPAHASTRFEIFLIGDARGAKVEASAWPTSRG